MILIEIIPNLWIGSNDCIPHLGNKNIKCVINCGKDLHFLNKYKQYKSEIKINLEKYEIIKLFEYLNETVEFIYNNITNNKSTIVVCESSNQKSPTVICAFLIKYGKMTKFNAIKSIRSKHSTAFYPDISYDTSLELYESKN